jgi:adenylate cyclase
MTVRTQRRLAAIVSADVVGYSRLMGVDETGTLDALRKHRAELIDPLIAQRGGRIVKTMGDGLLLEFPSVVDATQSAIEVQKGMAKRNEGIDENTRITFRIGVNLGDIIIEGDDILGDGVNIAARLQEISEPGGVSISLRVYEDVRDRLDAFFEDAGEQALKNISRPVQVWRWSPAETSASAMPNVVADTPLPLPEKPSIAVLPFDNMSGDPEQDYFSDGITEDIITELSCFRAIFVIARNSSFAYKGAATNIKQVGRELGVRYVLEGSVRKGSGRVRITAQLIEAETGNHLWAQRYDRVLEDVFELQDEITETIVAAIEPELEDAERERARRKPPTNLDVWEGFQRGMWHIYKMTLEEVNLAEEFFQKAHDAKPHYGPALAGLAYVKFMRVLLNLMGNRKVTRSALLDEGIVEAAAAVRMDERDAFPQYVLGRLLALKGDYDAAIERLTLAVDLNPNYALAHHGLGYSLAVAGRPAEAVEEFARALRLSPRDQYRWGFCTMRAFSLLLLKDYEGAIEWEREGIRDGPQSFWPHAHLTSALGHLGRQEQASRALADLYEVKPDFSVATLDETMRLKNSADRAHYIDGLRKAGLPG